jgi:hypothetical protein
MLAGFNGALRIWPMVAMNVALCAINLWHIRTLVATRHDAAAYEVLPVGSRDEYLLHLLRVHRADILKHQPDFTWDGDERGNVAYLIQRADETVGVVLINDDGDGIAQLILDYVTPRFRDFSPGEFVWRRSQALRERGYTKVVTPVQMVGAYYDRLGFARRPDGAYELVL